MKSVWLVVVLACLVGPSCVSERATAADCQRIFSRLVELELEEMGFRDPALAALRQTELSGRYRGELEACVGRPLAKGAMECVANAKNAEHLSHDCFH